MVERGHFKELQTIMDMLPKTQHELAAENEKPPPRRKRRRENKREDEVDEEQEDDEQEDENVEVYPDSDDDNVEDEDDVEDEEEDEEHEEDVEQGDDEEGDEEQEEEEVDGFFPAFPDEPSEDEDGDQQIVAEDISMDAVFPVPVNVEPLKKRQTLVFSATLALPPGFKKKLKRGFFEDKSVLKKNEYSVASLIQKAAMRSNAAIVDLTTKDILAKKLEESVIE